jgi:hypothetical protein
MPDEMQNGNRLKQTILSGPSDKLQQNLQNDESSVQFMNVMSSGEQDFEENSEFEDINQELNENRTILDNIET